MCGEKAIASMQRLFALAALVGLPGLQLEQPCGDRLEASAFGSHPVVERLAVEAERVQELSTIQSKGALWIATPLRQRCELVYVGRKCLHVQPDKLAVESQ